MSAVGTPSNNIAKENDKNSRVAVDINVTTILIRYGFTTFIVLPVHVYPQ